MAIKHGSVTVTTAAASLLGAVDDTDAAHDNRNRGVLVTNEHTADMFIGGSDVTTSSYGYKLAAGASVALDLGFGDIPYAIVASGSGTARVLHSGV